jgi:hypothetical protein
MNIPQKNSTFDSRFIYFEGYFLLSFQFFSSVLLFENYIVNFIIEMRFMFVCLFSYFYNKKLAKTCAMIQNFLHFYIFYRFAIEMKIGRNWRINFWIEVDLLDNPLFKTLKRFWSQSTFLGNGLKLPSTQALYS